MRLSNVLVKPVVSEKSVALNKEGFYIFIVSKESTKGKIRQELKDLYNVDAVKINTITTFGKKRRKGKTRLYTNAGLVKKAMVLLKKGQTLDLYPTE